MSPSWAVKQAWAYQMRGWWEPKVSRSAEFVLYLCAATFASTTPTLRTHDRTGSISSPRPLSFNPLTSRIRCSWIPNIYTLLRSAGNTFLKQFKKKHWARQLKHFGTQEKVHFNALRSSKAPQTNWAFTELCRGKEVTDAVWCFRGVSLKIRKDFLLWFKWWK